ncbi:MAG: hypothetical protein OXF54_16610 [Caldilineaceae bacterium]|nr:hypothetical protein [Caldilineaceae bacterium]
MSANVSADGRGGEHMADRRRHITAESGNEIICLRADADDAVIELLRPLVARAIDTGERVDIPAGYWMRAEEREIATLEVGIGHSDTGAQALRRIACKLGDLDKCFAWAYL